MDRELEQEWDEDEMFMRYCELDMKESEEKDTTEDVRHEGGDFSGVFTSPLLEILSVSVYIDKPCLLYGTIKAVDGVGQSFFLFDTPSDMPLNVSQIGDFPLTLTGQNTGSPGVVVDVDLKVSQPGGGVSELAKCAIDLNVKDLSDYERVLQSVKGSLSISYFVYPYAARATIIVGVEDVKTPIEVYGSIKAMREGLTSVIFNRSSDECRTLFGKSWDVSNSLVPVPAYCPFSVSVNLRDGSTHEPIADGTIQIQYPFHSGGECRNLVYEWGTILVYVKWSHVYSPSGGSEIPHPSLYEKTLYPAMEVHSILAYPVCSPGDSIICGRVQTRVGGCMGRLIEILKVDKEFPGSQDPPISVGSKVGVKLTSLTAPSALVSDNIALNLLLKEGSSKVSSGGFSWPEGTSSSSKPSLWCNKPMCCIIPGYNGFAAVHFSLISSPVAAKFSLSLDSTDKSYDNVRTVVTGVVVVQLMERNEKSNVYETSFFRSEMFVDETKSEANWKPEITLKKSLVCLPRNSLVEVILKLKVCNKNDGVFEVIEDTIPLKAAANNGAFVKEICGKCWNINLNIELSDLE